MKAKNKDFSAVLRTDLTTSLVPSVAQVICACNVVVYLRAKKVVSDSPGLVDFAIGLVNCF